MYIYKKTINIKKNTRKNRTERYQGERKMTRERSKRSGEGKRDRKRKTTNQNGNKENTKQQIRMSRRIVRGCE